MRMCTSACLTFHRAGSARVCTCPLPSTIELRRKRAGWQSRVSFSRPRAETSEGQVMRRSRNKEGELGHIGAARAYERSSASDAGVSR